MVFLGLVLFAASAGLAADLVIENAGSFQVTVLGTSYSVATAWFLGVGGAIALVGLVGLELMWRGLASSRRRRATLNESLGAAEELKVERDRLAAALEAERMAHDASPPGQPSVRVDAPTAKAVTAAQQSPGLGPASHVTG